MTDNQTQKDRIKLYISHLGISIKAFEEKSNLSNGYISSMRKGIGHRAIEQISDAFPQLNIAWLLTGEGEMIKNNNIDKPIKPNRFKIPPPEVIKKWENMNHQECNSINRTDDDIYYTYLLPMRAMGGSLAMAAEAAMMRDCEKIISPIGRVDFAITITGESMTPEYPNGSQVLIKKVNEQAFIEWGRVYVLDTCNGPVIKKLMPSMRGDDHVMCVSINPDYPPFDVNKADVFGVYQVLMCLARK